MKNILTNSAAVVIAWALLMLLISMSEAAQVDLEIFLEASRKLAAGEGVFTNYQIQNQPVEGDLYFLYPPLLPLLLQPLLIFSNKAAYFIFGTISFAALAAACHQIASLVKIIREDLREKNLFLAIFLAAMFFGPVWSGFRDGQVHSIIFFLITSYTLLLVKGRGFAAGSALAVASAIKMSPMFLILWTTVCKKKSVVLGFFTVGTLLFIILYFAPMTAQAVQDFFFQMPRLAKGALFNQRDGNYALTAVVNRHLLKDIWSFEFFRAGFTVVLFLLSIRVIKQVRRSYGEIEDSGERARLDSLGIAFLVCVMMLLSPIMWIHHLTWLLLPLSLLWFDRPAESGSGSRTILILIYLYLATFEKLPVQFGFPAGLNQYFAWVIVPGIVVVAIACLLVKKMGAAKTS